MKSKNAKIRKFNNFPLPPTSPEGVFLPDKVLDVITYKRFKVTGLLPRKSAIYSKRAKRADGEDGSAKYMGVLSPKSVKLPPRVKIKIQKFGNSETFAFPNFTWRGLSPIHGPVEHLLEAMPTIGLNAPKE